MQNDIVGLSEFSQQEDQHLWETAAKLSPLLTGSLEFDLQAIIDGIANRDLKPIEKQILIKVRKRANLDNDCSNELWLAGILMIYSSRMQVTH